MSATATKPDPERSSRRRIGGWFAGLAAAIIAPLAVALITGVFSSTPRSTPPPTPDPVLQVGRPTYQLMTRGSYLRDVLHESARGVPENLLRVKGVRLIANVHAGGLRGRVLEAECSLYDITEHHQLSAEKLRLHVTASPYLDPPCWRPLRAGHRYQGSIAVTTPAGGQRNSLPVTLRWKR